DLKRALTSARGRRPAMRLLVAASPAVADALRARGVAPYADGLIDPALPLMRIEDLFTPLPPESTVLRTLPDGSGAWPIAAAAAAAASWFPAGLVPVPGRPLICGEDRRVAAYLNPRTLDLVGTSRSCPAPAMVTGDVAGMFAERLDVGDVSAFRLRADT